MKFKVIFLTCLLVLILILSSSLGVVSIEPMQVIAIILDFFKIHLGISYTDVHEAVVMQIRLPRVFLAMLIGAVLSLCGLALQSVFRNPLADPNLIGIGSGASFAVVLFIVFGNFIVPNLIKNLGPWSLSIAAFIGAFAAMIVVYKMGTRGNKTDIAVMLLAGIAINALGGALTGLVTLSANDDQLRSFTFWTLGSLAAANWTHVLTFLPIAFLTFFSLPRFARGLNALALGEADAQSMGFKTQSIKTRIMLISALGVGAAVSLSGIIGFVGLVVPHIFRLWQGPDNTKLMPLSILGGAFMLSAADLVSRTLAAPIELPVSVVTSILGAPFFMYLILKEKKKGNV